MTPATTAGSSIHIDVRFRDLRCQNPSRITSDTKFLLSCFYLVDTKCLLTCLSLIRDESNKLLLYISKEKRNIAKSL